jgi:hypothetical protein
MAGRDWVRAIKRELRDDLGDCPTLPEEMLAFLKADMSTADEDWVRRFASTRHRRPIGKPYHWGLMPLKAQPPG